MTRSALRLRSARTELVPLAERVRYLQLFRVAAAAAVVMTTITLDSVASVIVPVSVGTVAYLAVSALWSWLWRRAGRRGLALFGGLLILDGVYLAWVTYRTGGTDSPVRYVILLHLIAVALLASYRTSLKLALWHSLLAFVVFQAEGADVLTSPGAGSAATGSSADRLAAFIVVFWMVSLVTATFSAVNERELRRRRFDLEALAAFAADMESTAAPSAIADGLLAHLTDVFGFRRAALLASPSGGPQLLAHLGCTGAVPESVAPHPSSVVERVKRSKATLLAAGPDGRADPWLTTLMPSPRNLVIVPLSAEDGIIGTLICEHDLRAGSRIEQRVVAMVERFVAHAALALRNSWLLEEVRAAANTDGLTGVSNRRAFDELLAQEVSRATRSGEPLSLVLIDIDHFKDLNDTHGHQAGDDVLREIGSGLARGCRGFDTPARYGGEEFAVILPRCSAEEAHEIGERIRRTATAAVTVVPVTASAGVATFPQQAGDADALVAGADAALYEAKRTGRNRLVAADPRLGTGLVTSPTTFTPAPSDAGRALSGFSDPGRLSA